jgi:hypothetical protein
LKVSQISLQHKLTCNFPVKFMNAMGSTDLEQIEKHAYITIWEDGLIDIFVGLALVVIGTFWLSRDSAYGALVAPVLVPFWTVARNRISEPRRGIVKLSAERVAKESRKLAGLVLFGVATLTVGIVWYVIGRRGGSQAADWAAHIVAGLPATLLAVPVIIVAFAHGLNRFLIYAALLLASAVAVVLLDLRPGWGFMPAGIACLVIGGAILSRFIRTYPLTD